MYNISTFANLVGKSVLTIQRWDREGVLPAKRDIRNRRYYTFDDIVYVLGDEQVARDIVTRYERDK